jgi:hypothetical protein
VIAMMLEVDGKDSPPVISVQPPQIWLISVPENEPVTSQPEIPANLWAPRLGKSVWMEGQEGNEKTGQSMAEVVSNPVAHPRQILNQQTKEQDNP